ncbi:unnamed protein product [Rotaria sp. Silwood1]|nr:unnamed protein product [Rotaria sp. Silwood1]CAF1269526.1 unnamed protein product [Rotaria sp. Silwood1]
MIKLNLQYHYLLFLFYINCISGQICQNNIADFFYNVNFAGPFFDQTVYTVLSNFSVSTPNNTQVFNFIVKPQTIDTRPSFIPITISNRARDMTLGNISVTSSHPSFTVVNLANDSYALLTNTFPLNYFSPYNRYLFQLIAKQTFSNRPPVTSIAQVQINLENDNVHDPMFIPNNQIFYISEAAQLGTQFGTVYAIDLDNDEIIYSVHCIQFCIESTTGVLRLEKPFDSSSQSEYFINVTATDSGSSCSSRPLCRKRTKSINIRIIVTAVNRNSPRFINPLCGKNISFDENNTIGQEIVSLIVFDSDRGENGLINISFPSEELRTTVSGLRNTAYSQFYIEQLDQINTTRMAVLRADEIFDYDKPGMTKSKNSLTRKISQMINEYPEKNWHPYLIAGISTDNHGATRVWYLFILANDNGKPQRQAFCSLRINLHDVNDNAPVFIMTSWNYIIYRSSMNKTNTRFLRIIASDADSGLNGMINYYIGTAHVPYFSIIRTTGTIILRSDIFGISYLNMSYFPITFYVYAQDRGTPPLMSKNNATVTIYLNDSDDPPAARWLDTRYEELNISITEKFYENYRNQPIFDYNYGFNGSIIYELTSQTSSIMTVSSPFLDNTNIPFRDIPVVRNGRIFRSGITVTSGLHAEIQNVYLLYIRVLVNPPLIGSIIIRLKDENDQIPTFDIRSIVLSVIEKEYGNRIIAQIQAFDRDIDYQNSYVQYRLNERLSDNEALGNFHVEQDGTIWTNTIFGEQTNKTFYRLFITAYNDVPAWNSPTQNSQDFQLDIQVISINDKRPVFNNGLTLISILINETSINGTNILNITIVDLDINTNLNLGILNGNFRNTFIFTLLSDNSYNLTRTQYEAIGQLIVIGPLDYELISDYKLVLFAFDTKNIATINVTVKLQPQNTKAPYFDIMPGSTSYQYQVFEETPCPILDESCIQAIDPDYPKSHLHYEIYDTNYRLNLNNLFLTQSNNCVSIGIKSPGLSRDLPFGDSVYNFAIRVIDEDGLGVSSYIPVSIKVIDVNNKAPMPTNFPWIFKQGINPSIEVIFKDYDDPKENNTIPYTVKIVHPSNFKLIGPTINFNGSYKLIYNGMLNRTLTKNLTVTFHTSDHKGFSKITTIPIIIRDELNIYPISNASKTIKIIYVNDYQNSLRNIDLGSIYVNDLNDWFHSNRIYSVRYVSNGQIFNVSNGFLRTSEALYPGSYTIHVEVTKPNVKLSAFSKIYLEVETINSEYVREASTIRIQGEYPETLIDPTLGYPLNKLQNALVSLLSVTINSIKILAIRPVFQYRSSYYPPKTFELDKNETLIDVIFYVPNFNKFEVEYILNANLNLFESRFKIKAIASGPNPCNNYVCPTGTSCRPTRTIHPKPSTIDTNLTSFVGINILDSADCINSTYTVNLINKPNECITSTFNNLTYCSSISLLSYGTIGPCCEILGRTFNENGDGYAIYAGTRFSNIAPARFSFDFILRSPIIDGLILLYGRNLPPINDFFWIAIEIYQTKLKFHFRNTKIHTDKTILNPLTWYHVECQFIDSMVLLSVNDCQYGLYLVNNTLNTYNLSTVKLYLGGLPMTDSLLSSLYSSLPSINTFNGCIRNVLSNGYYLDMSKDLSSANSNYGECPCSITNSCITKEHVIDIIIPWYTWLILVLVLLLLATIFSIVLLILTRKRKQLKTLTGLYMHDTRDDIISYKDTAGEEDHSRYNLRVLKRPIYDLQDSNIISHNSISSYHASRVYLRPSLSDYIEKKLDEQVISYANDTKLHYQYEGEGSIASDLSSMESLSLQDENDYRFLYSLGLKFSPLEDRYSDHVQNNNNNNT